MGMRFDPPKCPECGEDPLGTLEDLTGRAEFSRQEDDGAYEYSGSTEVFWDGQMTRTDEEGKVALLCENGHDWFATRMEGHAPLFRVA